MPANIAWTLQIALRTSCSGSEQRWPAKCIVEHSICCRARSIFPLAHIRAPPKRTLRPNLLIMRCDLENSASDNTALSHTKPGDRLICTGKLSPLPNGCNWKQKQIGYLFWPSILNNLYRSLFLMHTILRTRYAWSWTAHRADTDSVLTCATCRAALDRPSLTCILGAQNASQMRSVYSDDLNFH